MMLCPMCSSLNEGEEVFQLFGSAHPPAKTGRERRFFVFLMLLSLCFATGLEQMGEELQFLQK